MTRQVILVRHAPVEIDPALPPGLWPLSDAGRAAARRLAGAPLWRDVVRIFVSPEIKAMETAHIIAGPNGITVTAVEDLREVERPADQRHNDYPAAVAAYFARPDAAADGWEPPASARARITACIDGLAAWELGRFAVCGHGLTLALYVGALGGADPAAVWRSMRLPDVAVVEPGRAVLRPFGAGAISLAPTPPDRDR